MMITNDDDDAAAADDCSGLGYIVGSYVAELFGAWQWSLRVSINVARTT